MVSRACFIARDLLMSCLRRYLQTRKCLSARSCTCPSTRDQHRMASLAFGKQGSVEAIPFAGSLAFQSAPHDQKDSFHPVSYTLIRKLRSRQSASDHYNDRRLSCEYLLPHVFRKERLLQ